LVILNSFKINGIFFNQNIIGMFDMADNKKEIPIGGSVEIRDNQQLVLSKEEGGRLLHVQMVTV
jgi:hypothetical protein